MSLLTLMPITFTDRLLEIKIRNTSGAALDKRLVLELSPPTHLVDEKIIEAAREAAVSEDPPGAASLAGIVTGPTGWSVWVRREASDSSLFIVFINDMDQTGTDLEKPIAFAAGAETLLRIPLDPDADRVSIDVLYDYQHGKTESDPHYTGKLRLTSEPSVWKPDVTLTTDATSPTAINPGTKVKVFWHIADGVSAGLRGPLPGGNTELSFSSDPAADFKIPDGALEVRVMGATTYVLQAIVRRPNKSDVQVRRMLSFDTLNQKYTYLNTPRTRVLLNGLIEINWAAWGVKQVMLSVSDHTTRVVKLTQQTVGRFYEGSGVMRVTATRREIETIDIEGLNFEGTTQQQKVTVITWKKMTKPVISGRPLGMSVIAPKLMVLTNEGLFIAEVGEVDPTSPPAQLSFSKVNTPAPAQWLALTGVLRRFVTLRRTHENDLEVAPYKFDGTADEIPPLTLPADLRPFVGREGAVFDFIGFAGRAYVVVEAAMPGGPVRRAFSVGFDGTAKRAEYRPEPLLESLPGYTLVTFDNALYALHRGSARMLRFERSTSGSLQPLSAASAITKSEGAAESMIREGSIVPVGRLLVALNPNAVPSLKEVEEYGLRNVLPYSTKGALRASSDIPQDLFYNPQKNYWGRCGHDLDVKPGAVAAFRSGGSPRLWVIQPDGETYTLAVGSENLFAHDYWYEFPTKSLPEYLNKKRKFTITNKSGFRLLPLGDKYASAGLVDFSAGGPAEVTSKLPNPFNFISTESFELRYNETDPAPVCLRFLAGPHYGGVKRHYMLELTLSGPNLSTATSVFKGIAVDGSGSVSVAEIPGTRVQHSTNEPIVIPEAKPLTETMKLRFQNFTTYQLLRTSALGGDPYFYSVEENISANTPQFSVLAYGTGTLPIELDFSLPKGIEISPGTEPQRKLIRINSAQKGALHPELLPGREDNTYELKISYRKVRELDCVYVSDPVPLDNGAAIYVPVALPQDQSKMQVWHIDVDYLADMRSDTFTGSDVFSASNGIALADEYIFAMFGDTNIHVLNYGLQLQDTLNVNNSYTVVTGIKANVGNNTHFLLGMKQEKTATPIPFRYILGNMLITKATSGPRKITWGVVSDVSLDAVKGFREQIKMPGSPSWVSSLTVSPMAVSPTNVSPRGERVKEVAICIDGGLFLVGKTDRDVRSLKLDSVGREEDIVFGRDGRTIYCLHSSLDNQTLRVTRVDSVGWKPAGSISLPRGEGVADLTTYDGRRDPGIYKNQRSASLVRTQDEKLLFVSHGKSIFKIDTATMTVRDTYTLDLPCRVFHVGYGKPEPGVHPIYGSPSSCILLYAIGASYKGNGRRGSQFKTQIYKIGILDK